MPTPLYYIFYDGTCLLCQNSKRWLQTRDPHSRFTFIDSRDPAAMSPFPSISPHDAQGQMIVLTSTGQSAAGFDAILLLLPSIPRWRILLPLLRTPLGRSLGKRAYRWIATHRYRLFGKTPSCNAGACRV